MLRIMTQTQICRFVLRAALGALQGFSISTSSDPLPILHWQTRRFSGGLQPNPSSVALSLSSAGEMLSFPLCTVLRQVPQTPFLHPKGILAPFSSQTSFKLFPAGTSRVKLSVLKVTLAIGINQHNYMAKNIIINARYRKKINAIA